VNRIIATRTTIETEKLIFSARPIALAAANNIDVVSMPIARLIQMMGEVEYFLRGI